MENKELVEDLLIQVKANKKYKTIANEIIEEEIKKYLAKNKINKISKQDVSEIRKELHRLYSSYQTKKKNKRYDYLEELKQNLNDPELLNKLLRITISTTERIDDYENLYKQIFQLTGIPKTIIDLGSGLNPLSFPLMHLSHLNYYAYEIDTEDIDFLNKYFEIMKKSGLYGKSEILDAKNLEKIKQIPNSDIVFMFKLIDLIDKKHKKTSEELIKIMINKTKFIVASFATKTITRKPMNLPKRKGFELMLQRINLKFTTIETDNEIFYIISK